MTHPNRTTLHSAWGTALVLTTALAAPLPLALAEGTAQLGTSQALRAGTILYVDIENASLESVRWTGRGNVSVVGPNGAMLGAFASDSVIPCTDGAGVYALTVASDQSIGALWDVTVEGGSDPDGRLFSKNWQFNAGAFSQSAATDASFYALVPGGDGQNTSVIELKLGGLAGYIYDVNANSKGVDGPNAGRSVPEAGNGTSPDYAIYLQPPAKANYEATTPAVYGLNYVGGVDEDVFGNAKTPCTQILPEQSQGYFYFNSETSGSYHLQCDLDRDGSFEIGSGDDLLLIGEAEAGTNVVAWDGTHNGIAVDVGTYACHVLVTVGEFHYVGRDIETSYPGMRMFRVNADGSRTGLDMYWNDALVQANATTMPSGGVGLESSDGTVNSGAYEDSVTPNVNARSWGNFSSGTKGNVAYLDTYVWLREAVSSDITVTATDSADSDGDGLSDFEEECLIGSDPEDADTDDDGNVDGEQYAVPNSSAFSGLESNGRLSSALARRAIRRTRMSFHPSPLGSLEASLVDESLARWFPETLGAGNRMPGTPVDLLGVTNALEVAGTDYNDADGHNLGAALLVTTAGAFYEHQKAVCDRVKGARLLDVRSTTLNGQQVFESTVSDPETGRLEYSVTVYLVEDADAGSWMPHSLWVKEQAPAVPEGARVMTLQAWGRTPTFARELASAILDKATSEQPIAWPEVAPVLDDEAYAANPPASRAAPLLAPTALIQQALTLGGQLDLHLLRRAGAGDYSLRIVALDEDGATERIKNVKLSFEGLSGVRSLKIAPFLDATVDLLDDGETVDRVWVSDGAWAPYDDSIYDGNTEVERFSRTDCTLRSLEEWDVQGSTEGVHLAGCARTELAGGGSSSGLSRHLTRRIALAEHAGLGYFIDVDQAYQVCVDGSQGHACVEMSAAPKGAYQAIPLAAFSGVDGAELFTFTAKGERSTSMEVSALTLLQDGTLDTRSARSGCSVSSAARRGAFPLHWAALLGLLLHRRRRMTS